MQIRQYESQGAIAPYDRLISQQTKKNQMILDSKARQLELASLLKKHEQSLD